MAESAILELLTGITIRNVLPRLADAHVTRLHAEVDRTRDYIARIDEFYGRHDDTEDLRGTTRLDPSLS